MKSIYFATLVFLVSQSEASSFQTSPASSPTPPLIFTPSPVHAMPEELKNEVSTSSCTVNPVIVPKQMLERIDEFAKNGDISALYQSLQKYGFIDEKGNFTLLIKKISMESSLVIIDRLICALYEHKYHDKVLDVLKKFNFISVANDIIPEVVVQLPFAFTLSWITKIAELTCPFYPPTMVQPKTYFDRILELFHQAGFIDKDYEPTDTIFYMPIGCHLKFMSQLTGALNEKKLFSKTLNAAWQAYWLDRKMHFTIDPEVEHLFPAFVKEFKDEVSFAIEECRKKAFQSS